MKNFKMLIIAFVWFGVTASAVEEQKAAAPATTQHFERLIDVDYSFFMTKAKLPWGVDPFMKEPGYAKVPTVEEKFELSGILYSKDEQIAIINGKSVQTGDQVGDRQVEEIGSNFVILRKQGSEIELNLPPVRDPASDEEVETEDEAVDDEESDV